MHKIRALDGLQNRTYTAPLTTRVSTDDDAMIVAGIGVPYDQEVELWRGEFESIAPGAVQPRDHRMLYYRHRDPIGRVISESDDADGWHHESQISDTPTGREAYTLARDGVVRKFSIGFYPVTWETHEDDDGNLHIRHTEIDVVEVSLVPIPAYDGADLTDVRHKSPEGRNTMTITKADLDALSSDVRANKEALEDIGRQVELLAPGAERTASHPLDQFESLGAFVRAVATGSEEARTAYEALHSREFEGSTIAGEYGAPTRTWIGAVLKIVEAQQNLSRIFNLTRDLPTTGTSVEYGRVKDDTTQVDVQENEGDDLTSGKVSIETFHADIVTLGGWFALSRQLIERTSLNMLDLHWRALMAKYGSRLEALTRATYLAAYNAAAAAPALELASPLATSTPSDWLRLILDAHDAYDADPYISLSGFLVSRDVFLALSEVESDKKMLVVKNTPDGAAGTITVTVPEADLYNVPIKPVPNWTGTHMAAYDANAIRTQVSPGAPWQLQDDNIINLTKAFSLYGYAASFTELPAGIKAVDLEG